MKYEQYRKHCLAIIQKAFLDSMRDQKDRFIYNGQNNDPVVLENRLQGSKMEIARCIVTDCSISLGSPKHLEKNIAFTFQA